MINTAILIIDLQNDFSNVITETLINNVNKLVLSMRENNIPIYWICSRYNNDNWKLLPAELKNDFSFATLTQRTHIGKKIICREGTLGAEFIDPIKNIINNETDIIIEKQWYSAFKNTNLEELLIEQHINTLIICGVTLNNCVLATSKNASDLGFNVILVSDAVGAASNNRFNEAILNFNKFSNIHTSKHKIITSQELIDSLNI